MSVIPRVSFPTRVEVLGSKGVERPDVVVAIPVKDEEARVEACLASLADQVEVDPTRFAVVLLLNNCTDTTAAKVRALSPHLPYALHLHEVELPEAYANAGWARRLGMEAAAELASPDGLILTTDADTLVETDWVAANQREIAAGVDAVAGYVMADPVELMELPAEILERGSLEWEYQQLVAEMGARVDPEPHDTWPRHNQNCGASAAITVRAYRRIGGLPPRPVGEDRALFEMLRHIDGKIRHSLDVQVVTSARTDGRALGGLSDAIRLRGEPDHACDEMLEVAMVAFRRAVWRRRLRALWQAGGREALIHSDWAQRLHVSEWELRQAADHACFGETWADIEAISPRLVRELVTGRGLKRELRRMRRLVEAVRAGMVLDASPKTAVRRARAVQAA
ncbi:glycosyltransferase family 2 protein [Caulobacter sp. S45]|uniref:glycosyltransferase n=1 Tax=Caulobacter sp. S45 TaxID=1641861 RepID=UPI00131DE013|nr:glycosyltransferase [Caulobacter sp. S45]